MALLQKKKLIESKSTKNYKTAQNNLLTSIKNVIVKQRGEKKSGENEVDEEVRRVEQSYNEKVLQIFQNKIQMNRLN